MNGKVDSSAEVAIRKLVDRAIESVKPSTLFARSFHVASDQVDAFGIPFELRGDRGVKCVAIGKSAEAMAHEVRSRLGARVSGIIASPVSKRYDVEGFSFFKAGHPFANEESVRAAKAARELLVNSDTNCLILFLISGGGSASIFVPIEGVSLEDANSLMKLMFDSGVPIEKVNLVRRHISELGGGKLAALAPEVNKISLVISDVVGDDLRSIASGPTTPDTATNKDALQFLEHCKFSDQVPKSILKALRDSPGEPPRGEIPMNTVKVIASNRDALDAAEQFGIESGLDTVILTSMWASDVQESAHLVTSLARSIELDGEPVVPPALILAGGETTVNLSHAGKGGRNQHSVLLALRELGKLAASGTALKRTTVFSFGTDGKDGNSDAAGAHASLETLKKARGGMDEVENYLRDFNSNTFFEEYGGLITTGPTDTNVMDILGIMVQ